MRIVKDPDDTWHTYIDWSSWLTSEQTKTGGTISITASGWTPSSANITDESSPATVESNNIAYFYGSCSTKGDYSIVNQITYTLTGPTSGAKTGLTKSKTLDIKVDDQ